MMRKRILPLLFLTIGLMACNSNGSDSANNVQYSMNAVIGNRSLAHLSSEELALLTENEKIQLHLEYVIGLLQQNSQSYPVVIQAKRMYLMDLLSCYSEAANFPVNTKYAGRRPCFIDEFGNYCAVGYLVKETAGEVLAMTINDQYQYDYIEDMHLKALNAWIANSGFTREEIAMIQPSYDFNYPEVNYAVHAAREIRRGNDPYVQFGLQRYIFTPGTGRGRNGYWNAWGVQASFTGRGNWAIGPEFEKVVYGIPRTPFYVLSGLSIRAFSINDMNGLHARPELKLTLRPKMKTKLSMQASAAYAYDIPVINQAETMLNPHLFLLQLQMSFRK